MKNTHSTQKIQKTHESSLGDICIEILQLDYLLILDNRGTKYFFMDMGYGDDLFKEHEIY